MSILIKNVFLAGKKTSIFVEGNVISKIGTDAGSKSDVVIDGSGKAAIPGFVNCHTHAAMTLMRGYADDLPLQEWLERHIWPLEAKLSEEDVYWGSKLACLEMIKSGTTCFNDMYWHLKGTLKAASESGLRSVLSSVFIDRLRPEKAREQRRQAEKLVKETKARERIKIALGPHAIYTVTKESLEWVREFAMKNDLLVHMHLSETKQEVEDCEKEHGKRPVEYLNDLGLLNPNLVCVHCVWLDEKEITLLAKNNVKVVHCPTSNMKLSVGREISYEEMHRNGINVTLGTDGCASNNSLDMFGAMKTAAILHKMMGDNPTILPAADAFKMATENGAKALRINAGRITEGALADVVLIDLKKPELVPLHNLTSNLVYSATGSCVDTVICDGRMLMQKGIVEGEEKLMEKAGEIAERLVSKG